MSRVPLNARTGMFVLLVAVALTAVLGTAWMSRPKPKTSQANLRPISHTLSNGCAVSDRGIPACGAYVGAAVGGNTDPTELEQQLGHKLAIRRTYWNVGKTEAAIGAARADLAAGRLPWLSFKLDVSWQAATAGEADEWVESLARQLSLLPGPVWVALHHEPEGDGEIGQWRAMQERLGPLLRERAPNVGFTVILTGWNQIHRPEKYGLARVWPHTTVDVAGFDIYQHLGGTRRGKETTTATNLNTDYFQPLSQWARDHGVAWALAETGVTNNAAGHDPTVLADLYDGLTIHGGIALTYFHSTLNSTQDWTLNTPAKRSQFAGLLERSPHLVRLE